ncbi:MAG: VanW family protein [Clostridia bacterium]|nr:VanW family protein [Clostridia bacterium]
MADRNKNGQQVPPRVGQAADSARANASMNSNMSWTGRQQGYVPQQPAGAPVRNPYTGPGMNMQNTWPQPAMRGAAPEPPKDEKPRGKSIWGTLLIIFIALGIVAGLSFYGLSRLKTEQINRTVEPYNSLYCEGVYVDGIALAGMTPEQAYNMVTSKIRQQHDQWSVQLTYGGQVLCTIRAEDLGIASDMDRVVKNALNNAWLQGHTGNNMQRANDMERLKAEPWSEDIVTAGANMSVIDTLLENIKSTIDRPAQDAYLTEFNTDYSYPFLFQPETTGLSMNIEPLKEQLYGMVASMQSGTVEVVPDIVYPSVTMEALKKNYTLLSTATTNISTSSTEERNDNIRRAFEKINGTVLKPGEQFSFNTVVGERTVQNGFKEAVEYVYGEHVMGIGGGVCQASTTVYQAAVCAGMKIVKRSAHSDAVGYCDYGMDATVYWVGKRKIDLVFKNESDSDIFITACVTFAPKSTKKYITRVEFYGKDLNGVTYEMTTEVAEVLPAPVEPSYVKDKNAEYVTYTDQMKSVSKAQDGYVVNSYRIEYTNGVETGRKLLYKDTFEPKAEKIYVGVTKRPEE